MIVEVTGEIASIGSLATIYFLTDPLSATPNNFINNFGIIAANDYSNVYFEQATVTNDAIQGVISAGDYGTVTFDQGSILNNFLIETNNYGGVGYGAIVFNGTNIDNYGTIAANDYGTVSFEPGTTLINEIGGEVIAENYGTLVLDAGNTITSQDHGLFEAIGGGEIDVKDSGIFNVGTSPLASLDPSGILLGSAGTLLVDVAELTLDGSGALVLGGGTIAGQAANAADILDNLNNVISGSGLISNLTLFNGGTVDATSGLLTVDFSVVTNTNLFEANGGTLVLSNTSLDNSDHHNGDPVGTITVTASGMLYLESATISDGALNNAGTVETKSGTSTISDIADPTLAQNNNDLIVDGGTTLNLTDDYISGGTITVDSGGILNLTDTTITGANLDNEGGTINIYGTTTIDTIQSVLVGQTTVESGQTLDLNNEVVLGSITVDGATTVPILPAGILNILSDDTIENGALDNAGQINVTGTSNEIENTASFTNSGNIEVKAGATLTLSGVTIDDSLGSITVDPASPPAVAGLLMLTNTSITNGTFDNNGTLELTGGDTIQTGAFDNTATVTATGASNQFDNETVADFSNSGGFEVEAGGELTLSGDTLTTAAVISRSMLARWPRQLRVSWR